ncbi:MAG: hypothetical protein HOP25_02790 [Methylotenera sp.]|nr:hypothetical protein [Methylotenera sp.]
MRIIFLLIVPLIMSACTSGEQKSSEKFIKETIDIDWDDGIPFDDLFHASKICQGHSDYEGCNEIDAQVTDVSVSLKSCAVDQRSWLCRTVVLVISKHPIYKVLPDVESMVLPSNPFYWSLPTHSLEAQASNFDYRLESISWWWGKWKIVIFLLITLLLFAFGLYHYRNFRQKIQLQIAQAYQEKIALKIEEEQLLQKQALLARRNEAAKLEAEKEVELAKQKLFEEENRIALEVILANEKSEKLAKEKAEADALLQAVFKRKN